MYMYLQEKEEWKGERKIKEWEEEGREEKKGREKVGREKKGGWRGRGREGGKGAGIASFSCFSLSNF